MTTMIAEFFGVTREITQHGRLKSLGDTVVKLHLALWHQSERPSTRKLTSACKGKRPAVNGPLRRYVAECLKQEYQIRPPVTARHMRKNSRRLSN